MKTVILCGGLGMRLREVAQDLPKPMVRIGNYPILLHIMRHYSSYNFKEFILCLGYKSEEIKNYFLNLHMYNYDFQIKLSKEPQLTFFDNIIEQEWKILFAETGLQSLTGTRVKKIKKYLDNNDDFFLTYGDGISDIDLNELFKFHKDNKKIMTVTGVVPPGRFGEIIYDENYEVKAFTEKSNKQNNLISGGFFVCNKKIFDYLSDDDHMIEEVPMTKIAMDNQMIVFNHKGFWHAMDTPRDYEYLNKNHCNIKFLKK